MLFFHCKRSLIEVLKVKVVKNVAARNITEKSYLVLGILVKLDLCTTYDNIWLKTHSLHSLNC